MAAITPPVARLKAEVFGRFPETRDLGLYNCRKIRGSTIWSQHAWGNALDIGVPSLASGDRVKSWVDTNRSRLGLGTVLWRVADHYDHLHVEGSPKLRGTPSCAGGPAVSEGFRPVPVGATPTGEAQPIPGWFGVSAPAGSESARRIEEFGSFADILRAPGRFLAEAGLRVGQTLAGAILIILGLIFLWRELGGPTPGVGVGPVKVSV